MTGHRPSFDNANLPAHPPGKVYLVGAGPGAPDLITLRGLRALRRADVVLYDYLVNPHILRAAPAGAELICLGKHGATRIWSQQEINARMVELAQQGKTVVRLKGGDPAVFGRLAEELECLTAQRIPFEVIPGVTAASALSAYAGIPLTHRDVASAVALITGQLREGAESHELDYKALASFPGTLVFYMAVTTAPKWVEGLLAAGKLPTTPAAIVRRCSLPDQRVIRCTLAEVPGQIRAARLRPPALIVVGQVAATDQAYSWYEKLPLLGRTVLVTRPEEQAEDLAEPLSELGAEVLLQPAITIGPPADWEPVDQAIAALDTFAWIVFTSVNGVHFFMSRLRQLGRDWRVFGRARFAVIGPGTARALASYGFHADVQPPRYTADDLAALLKQYVAGRRILLVRASRGRAVLQQVLSQTAEQVVQVVAYRSEDVEHPEPDIAARMAAGTIDWVTVTSSAIARALIRLFGRSLSNTKLVSISPITSQTLRDEGFQPTAEAAHATMQSVVSAILQWEQQSRAASQPGS